jgi:hypothetical protein
MSLICLCLSRVLPLPPQPSPHRKSSPNGARRGALRLHHPFHYGFYLPVVLMAGGSLATAIPAGSNRSVFQKIGEALPATFDADPHRAF